MANTVSGRGVESPDQSVSTRSRVAWAIAFALPFLSLIIFRPWVPEPHPVWDWGDLVPHFRDGGGVLGIIGTLTERYGAEGRANLLSYLQLAVIWEAVGESAVGWQVLRAVPMLAMGMLFVLAGRRGGASPVAAGLGGLILLLGASSVEGWLFIMGEPLGVCFLLGILILSLDYPRTETWRLKGTLIGLLALGVLLTKEFMGIAILPVVAIAFCGTASHSLQVPRSDTRLRWLFGVLAIVLILVLVLVVATLRAALPGGYASAYGSGSASTGHFSALLLAMTLPTWFASSPWSTILYPANLLAVIVLVAGGAPALLRKWPTLPAWILVGVLPLIGAAAYSFWPRYSAFYGIPFWAGATGLLVASAAAVERRGGTGRVAAVAALALIAVFSAIVADRTVREKHALAGVAEEIAMAIPAWPGVDTVLMAVPTQGNRRWPVTGGELERYALALGLPESGIPPSLDISCEQVVARFRAGLARVALINDPGPCGPLPLRTDVHVRAYSYLDWLSFQLIRDSVLVESLVPAIAAGQRAGSPR